MHPHGVITTHHKVLQRKNVPAQDLVITHCVRDGGAHLGGECRVMATTMLLGSVQGCDHPLVAVVAAEINTSYE